jgi:hypothetical protein
MTRPSKRKIKVKEQEQDNSGRFAKKPQIFDDWGDWEDEDDSGWDNEDDEIDLLSKKDDEYKLVWSDNAEFERKKRGPYLAGKTKKSTYYDKYGPSGCFTKAAKGTTKISTFLRKNQSGPEDFEDILDDMEEEDQNQFNLNEKIENLKIELKEQRKTLTVAEYNKKRAIYEYFKKLDDDGNGNKIKASVEAAQLCFIELTLYRARVIRYWASYWL